MKKIDVKEAAKLAVLFLALINQFLSMEGKGPLPISNDEVNYFISTGFTVVTALYGYFDNRHLVNHQPETTNVSSDDASVTPKKEANPSEDK